MPHRFSRFGSIALALMVLCPTQALCWGDKGHEAVALIAEHYLDAAVRQKVLAILATQTDNLAARDTSDPIANEATWADKFRDSDRDSTMVRYNRTHNWHFVDLELNAPDIDAACNHHPQLPKGVPASQGDAKDCVTDKIEQFEAELADARTSPDERLMALRFLLHFVGDLHQPLHAADDHDQGGNAKRARGPGLASNKLHHHWDTSFVDDLGATPETIAAASIAKISKADRARWSKGTPKDWAQESYQLARTDAYGKLPRPDAHHTYMVGKDYIGAADKDVAEQLEKAGVRLAEILNRALH